MLLPGELQTQGPSCRVGFGGLGYPRGGDLSREKCWSPLVARMSSLLDKPATGGCRTLCLQCCGPGSAACPRLLGIVPRAPRSRCLPPQYYSLPPLRGCRDRAACGRLPALSFFLSFQLPSLQGIQGWGQRTETTSSSFCVPEGLRLGVGCGGKRGTASGLAPGLRQWI